MKNVPWNKPKEQPKPDIKTIEKAAPELYEALKLAQFLLPHVYEATHLTIKRALQKAEGL